MNAPVAFYSGYGNTSVLAEAIAAGAAEIPNSGVGLLVRFG